VVLESLNHPRDRTRWEGAMGYQGLLRQVLLRLVGCSWFSRWAVAQRSDWIQREFWLVTSPESGDRTGVQGVSFCGTSGLRIAAKEEAKLPRISIS
jgi:hypothetical protein